MSMEQALEARQRILDELEAAQLEKRFSRIEEADIRLALQALTSSDDDVEKAAWAMATVIANRHHPGNAATIGDIEYWMTDARREEARAALTARNNG